MVTETRQALSLNDVIAINVRAILRRFHLNRDWIIGLVGYRGSGKSIGGGNIAITDFGIRGEPMFSNMKTKLNIDVSEKLANIYQCEPGTVTYEAQRIERSEFLALDDRFAGGVVFLDEINIEYGEARRSQSNVNLGTDTVVQQLRKIQSGLIYTTINEMYVDPRIRENTDVFIRCNDTAFYPQNLANRMKQGVCFEWMIYPMTEKLAGVGNNRTGFVIGPVKLTLGGTWGMIDTWERQSRNGRSYSDTKDLMPVELVEAQAVTKNRQDPFLMALQERLETFWANHAQDGDLIEIKSKDMAAELGVEWSNWPHIFKTYIKPFFFDTDCDDPNLVIKRNHFGTKYLIKNRILA
jgi:hypothetical protein